MKSEILDFFSKLIREKSGIIYSEVNYFQLENRLEEISHLNNFESVDELYKYCRDGIHSELEKSIINNATNNETSFFRDLKVFDAFSAIIESKLAQGCNEFCIWSAASSSGQEPISIAIVLTELMKKHSRMNFSIIATDISDHVLTKAISGLYSQFEVRRGMSEAMLSEYFDIIPNGSYKVKPIISDKIKYKKLNLLDSILFDNKLDFIFCRNVLIYQDIEMKKQILSKIYDVLNDDGIVFLGSGESLISISDSFVQEVNLGAVSYKKKS